MNQAEQRIWAALGTLESICDEFSEEQYNAVHDVWSEASKLNGDFQIIKRERSGTSSSVSDQN